MDALSSIDWILSATKVSFLVINVILFGLSICLHKHRSLLDDTTGGGGGGDGDGGTEEKRTSSRRRTILIATAHPDDESMFFLPFIDEAVTRGHHLRILCLSSGNADGLGKIRTAELERCAESTLNVARHFVRTIDDPRLPDSMTVNWDTKVVGAHIRQAIKDWKIDTIVSFDSYGVSGHLNHRAVAEAVVEVSRNAELDVEIFLLESTSIWRKYLGLLDIPISVFTSSSSYTSVMLNPLKNYRAMATHASQFVWYRRLFIVFSRYSYVNTFVRLVESKQKTQ